MVKYNKMYNDDNQKKLDEYEFPTFEQKQEEPVVEEVVEEPAVFEQYNGPVTAEIYGKVSVPNLYVRESPSASANPVAIITQGTEVIILEEIDNWAKIIAYFKGEEISGYSMKEYIAIS